MPHGAQQAHTLFPICRRPAPLSPPFPTPLLARSSDMDGNGDALIAYIFQQWRAITLQFRPHLACCDVGQPHKQDPLHESACLKYCQWKADRLLAKPARGKRDLLRPFPPMQGPLQMHARRGIVHAGL